MRPDSYIRTVEGIAVEFRPSPRRRCPALTIEEERPVLLLPAGFSAARGEELCRRFRPKIEAMLRRRAALGIYPAPEYRVGGRFRWLGCEYPIAAGSPEGFDGECLRCAGSDPAAVARAAKRCWRDLALRMLTDKTFDLAERYGIEVREVSIGTARVRWGCCTASGRIRYSWRLGLCPEPLVDYVVAHEVAHRRHMDHSAAFWREVERLCPGAARLRREFRLEAMRLAAWK